LVLKYYYLQPVVSSFIAVILGIDVFGWKKILAAVLIFLGVYIVTQSKSRQQIENEIMNKT
jgi:drug/metabolite transporter (DMT)-like permease